MIDIKSEVVEDLSLFQEKFPCSEIVADFIHNFVSNFRLSHIHRIPILFILEKILCKSKFSLQVGKIIDLQIDGQKINACMIKDYPFHSGENHLNEMECRLLARLKHERFRGIMKFQRAFIPGTPIDEIDNALVSEKYCLYGYLRVQILWCMTVNFVGIFVR